MIRKRYPLSKKGLMMLTSGALLTFTLGNPMYTKAVGEDTPLKNITINENINWVKDHLSIENSKIVVDIKNHYSLEGNQKNYTAFSDSASIAEVEVSSDKLLLTVKGNGKARITLTGTDELNHSIQDTFEVDVQKMGDGNGDGAVTSADAQIVYKIISGKLMVSDEEKKKYDLDGDGIITNNDAIKIMNIYMKGPSYTPTFENYYITIKDINDAPIARKAAVKGTTVVGQILNGDYEYIDIEGDQQGTSTYKWYRGTETDGSDKTVIPGAISGNYTITEEDDNKYLFFEITPIAGSGATTGTPVLSAASNVVIPNEAPTVTTVTINGTPEVGQSLTGHHQYSDQENDQEGSSTYKWYRGTKADGSDKEEIAGANAKTYTLTAADMDQYLFFEVTPVASAGTRTGQPALSIATSKISLPNEAPTVTTVTINGTPEIGQTLTGQYQYSDQENDLEGSSTYKWYRGTKADGSDKEAIAGVTAQTYTLTSADKDQYLYFEVTPVASTGTRAGHPTLSIATSKISLPNEAPTVTTMTINGTPEVGQTLTGQYQYSDQENDQEGSSTYKWYRGTKADGSDKEEIAGANAKTYTLTVADKDQYLFFEITPLASTGTKNSQPSLSIATSKISLPNEAPTVTTMTINGTPEVGQTLTGQYQYSDQENDQEGSSTYKWYRGTKADGSDKEVIAGATAKTYKLTSADKDHYLFFEVTPFASTGTKIGIPKLSESSNLVQEALLVTPKVVSLIPQDNIANVSYVNDFVLNLDKNVTAQDKKIRIIQKNTNSLIAEYLATDVKYVQINNNQVIIYNPGLVQGVEYYIQVEDGAFTDSQGAEFEGMEDSSLWNFTTLNPSPTPFIAEYLNGDPNRRAIEVYFPEDGQPSHTVSGYSLEIHQWLSSKNTMKVLTVPLFPTFTGTLNITIEGTFYDFMDIGNSWYYNNELYMYEGINCAFLLKDSTGRIVDVVGRPFPNVQSHEEILPSPNTMIRKSGIHAGSTNYSPKEWLIDSVDIYSKIGHHTP